MHPSRWLMGTFVFMHRYFSLLLAALVFFCFSCVNEIEETDEQEEENREEELTQVMNLLENGTCEEWISFDLGKRGDYLDGWSLKENNGTVFQESDIVYEGKYAAKLCSPATGITAFVSQPINIASGHRLRIAFHYRMDYQYGTGARMYCYFREGSSSNIPNDVLSTFYDDATLDIIRGGGYGINKFGDTAGEWQFFDYTIQAPAIANRFVFEIHSYAGTTFYVDDCYVIDLDMR